MSESNDNHAPAPVSSPAGGAAGEICQGLRDRILAALPGAELEQHHDGVRELRLATRVAECLEDLIPITAGRLRALLPDEASLLVGLEVLRGSTFLEVHMLGAAGAESLLKVTLPAGDGAGAAGAVRSGPVLFDAEAGASVEFRMDLLRAACGLDFRALAIPVPNGWAASTQLWRDGAVAREASQVVCKESALAALELACGRAIALARVELELPDPSGDLPGGAGDGCLSRRIADAAMDDVLVAREILPGGRSA